MMQSSIDHVETSMLMDLSLRISYFHEQPKALECFEKTSSYQNKRRKLEIELFQWMRKYMYDNIKEII